MIAVLTVKSPHIQESAVSHGGALYPNQSSSYLSDMLPFRQSICLPPAAQATLLLHSRRSDLQMQGVSSIVHQFRPNEGNYPNVANE